MTRTYYRLSLSAVCAFAALAGPVIFLEDRLRVGYLIGGLAAALLTWGLLWVVMAMEPHLSTVLLGVAGASAAVFSWMRISMVTVFAVIPHVLQAGLSRFDPVWLMGGLAPLVIVAVAWWRAGHDSTPLGRALLSGLFRFSGPLLGLTLAVKALGLAKQYVWLSLFTGVMFLVLDGLGAGGDLPLRTGSDRELGGSDPNLFTL